MVTTMKTEKSELDTTETTVSNSARLLPDSEPDSQDCSLTGELELDDLRMVAGGGTNENQLSKEGDDDGGFVGLGGSFGGGGAGGSW